MRPLNLVFSEVSRAFGQIPIQQKGGFNGLKHTAFTLQCSIRLWNGNQHMKEFTTVNGY